MRGRRPTPPELRLLAGTLRQPHASPTEPDPEDVLRDSPGDLTKAQREEWRYIVQHVRPGHLRLAGQGVVHPMGDRGG